MINRTNETGFTIIETLVAVTVLMIAVAGPLVVAGKGLIGAEIGKNQLIASYLAQESMEVLKNIRDNNVDDEIDWLTDLTTCNYTAKCDASSIGFGLGPSVKTDCGAGYCRLYLDSSVGYINTNTGAPASKFQRAFYLHDAGTTNQCSSVSECTVTVIVQWDESSTSYSVDLTSIITASLR